MKTEKFIKFLEDQVKMELDTDTIMKNAYDLLSREEEEKSD